MSRILIFLTTFVMCLSVNVYAFAESTYIEKNDIIEKTLVYENNMTNDEKEMERNRQVQEQIYKLESDKFIIFNDPADYRTEWGQTKTVCAEGYAGNQPAWFNFPTGGGFWFSDSGGPSVSVSASFPKPFKNISFSVNLGNKGTSGQYVSLPEDYDPEGLYKLWVAKYYEVTPFVVYKRIWDEFEGEKWIEYSGGYSKILTIISSWAKQKP